MLDSCIRFLRENEKHSGDKETRLEQTSFYFSLFLLSSSCRSICHQYVSNIGKKCAHIYMVLFFFVFFKYTYTGKRGEAEGGGGRGGEERGSTDKTLEGRGGLTSGRRFTMVSREYARTVFAFYSFVFFFLTAVS